MLMRRQMSTQPDEVSSVQGGRKWLLRLLASAGGAALGLLTSLYSAELRQILEASGRGFVNTGLPVAITAAVASVSGVLIYELGFRRRYRGTVTEGEIPIGADALDGIIHDEDAVVGRSLRYLETKRFSEELVVFLHGLGLDADDFRPYMSESRFHCVALTLYGFNEDERDNDHYRPISLESHVQLVGYALRRIQRRYPHKRITLVGFSFGADMILCLREFAPETLPALRLHRVVLLDPNINNATTTISSRVADVDSDRSLRDLVAILRSAKTSLEFRYLCEYLSKITSKNFAHVRRHAREMSDRYRQRSFGPFLRAVGALAGVTGRIDVVLSLNHEEVFNAVARAAAARGLDMNRLECSRTDHFDLMGPAFLKQELEHPR
jgi:pimeloyl-ACP methyl ester carboxylesterase